MEAMATWEKILLGMFAVALLVWLMPGLKQRLENSRKATSDDWRGLLLPLGLVALFVIALLVIVSR